MDEEIRERKHVDDADKYDPMARKSKKSDNSEDGSKED